MLNKAFFRKRFNDAYNFFRVGEFITFGTEAVSEEFAAAPNYYKAVIASNRITKLLKLKPSIKKDVGFYVPIVIF
jgi:hypothetical protein